MNWASKQYRRLKDFDIHSYYDLGNDENHQGKTIVAKIIKGSDKMMIREMIGNHRGCFNRTTNILLPRNHDKESAEEYWKRVYEYRTGRIREHHTLKLQEKYDEIRDADMNVIHSYDLNRWEQQEPYIDLEHRKEKTIRDISIVTFNIPEGKIKQLFNKGTNNMGTYKVDPLWQHLHQLKGCVLDYTDYKIRDFCFLEFRNKWCDMRYYQLLRMNIRTREVFNKEVRLSLIHI
jgi:hypothetical protein